MEVIRRVFVLPWHVQLGHNSRQLVDELEMKGLTREQSASAYTQTQGTARGVGFANHVSHSFGFDTAGHATGRPGSLDLGFVAFCEIPDRVVWMAVNPEVISADIGEFLEVGLVYPRLV